MLTALHVLDTGYCLASEHHLMRGGRRQTVRCHALVGLLHHARLGWLLFDTGYHPRLFAATEAWPYRLYRRATPLFLTAEQSVAAQLPRFGLRPPDIRRVVLSHFHADHLSGWRDFPDARGIATRAAWEDVRGRRGWAALRRAFLPDLTPDGGDACPDLLDTFRGPALGPLGPTHDLAGDGSLLLVPLPGHARGQVGLYADAPDGGPVLFAADAAYLTRAVRENRPPHPVTNLFADDGRAVRETLARLHAFHRSRPDVRILPTHCPEARTAFVSSSPC